jgi:hypothetical protein
MIAQTRRFQPSFTQQVCHALVVSLGVDTPRRAE